MDELALLQQFRLEDAADLGAREHARRALATAMGRQRLRRRYAIALAFLGAAVLAGAAYGLARGLIVGDPAPAEVTGQLARFGQEADLIPYKRPDAPETKGLQVVAVLESSVGPVYLFGDAAGNCAHAWIEGKRGYQGRLDMSGVCGPPTETYWAFGRQRHRGRDVRLLSGHAGPSVARVAVRLEGTVMTVPLAGRWFFAEFAKDPTALVTYDREGRVVREFEINLGPSRNQPPPAPQPVQVGKARELHRIDARGGNEVVILEVARASDGGNCMIVRSDKRRTNRGCAVPTPGPREIGVVAMQFGGGAPDGIQLLVGPGRRGNSDVACCLSRRPARGDSPQRAVGALRGRACRLCPGKAARRVDRGGRCPARSRHGAPPVGVVAESANHPAPSTPPASVSRGPPANHVADRF